ncbi:alpha/beta hydrolase [Oceanobacillus chungangensis]|uniref:Esterase family protein n=1 Tax=Oceanobacillus chungangensis TaxID=1229152 RepID=A0A3D8PIP9_9BACI|nr:alpha/beta hydrolase-fold protein [Oceanobacillus chungangensis]RDW15966.1 hypothetical protein CWR45_15850 [Oceanobacillus chungangensis]
MGRKGSFIVKEIQSNYLNETKAVKIYLPESFSPLNKYNICIMQDGDDYFQMGRIATLSDRLHTDGEIENTVFAGIHYKNKADRRKRYHLEGAEHDAYTNFIVREVIPMLDEIIPNLQMGRSRALIGDSLAGSFALSTAIRYPNTFGKVIMQSPYVDDALLRKVKATPNLETLDIYHTIGTAEIEALLSDEKKEDLLTPNRELFKLLQEKGTNYIYYELADGDHTWKYWQRDMERLLKTMFN